MERFGPAAAIACRTWLIGSVGIGILFWFGGAIGANLLLVEGWSGALAAIVAFPFAGILAMPVAILAILAALARSSVLVLPIGFGCAVALLRCGWPARWQHVGAATVIGGIAGILFDLAPRPPTWSGTGYIWFGSAYGALLGELCFRRMRWLTPTT